MKRLISVVVVVLALAALFWLRPGSSPAPSPSRPASLDPVAPASAAPQPINLVSSLATLNPAAAPAGAPVKAATPVVAADPIETFNHWAQQFLSGDPAANVAQGEAMAWKRRQAMLELIQTDPEAAFASTVPFRWRQELPARITRHFEQRVDGRGALQVAVATAFDQRKSTVYRHSEVGGNRYQAFVYGRRLAEPSRSNVPQHLIVIDDKAAVSSEPLRMLEPGEAAALEQERGQSADPICGVSGQMASDPGKSVAAEAGGEILYFCRADHARLVNEQWKLAGYGNGFSSGYGTFANDAWTHGPKTLLYMRVNFPDDLTEPISEASAYAVMNSVNAFFTENSYDLTSLTATVTPLLTLPQFKAWYTTAGPGALLGDARAAARAAGYDTANFDLDIVTHTFVPGFEWGGLGFVGGKGTWLQSAGEGVTSHELGHNYGLWHANAWETVGNYSGIAAGTNSEYGNIYDTMGGNLGAQFNAIHKNILNWVQDSTVHDATSNGVYRIYSFDVSYRTDGRFYAAKVRKDFQRDYWIEFRQKFSANDWARNGVFLNWAPWEQSSGGSQLIDTTPGSPQDLQDAAVVIGRTFNDTVAGVYITPVAGGVTGADPWIDVQINSGAFAGNQPPEFELQVDTTNVAPGQLIHFHAAASDPDGDALAYEWSFDDFTFSINNRPWLAKSWPSAGEHVVRCVVSDMKGGVASANAVVRIGAPSGERISGRVTDLNGNPLPDVRVDNGAGFSSDYLGGYTDSDGRYVIVGIMAENTNLSFNAVLYGYTFTNVAWENPIGGTTDVVNADFIGVPVRGLTLEAGTNTVAENNGAAFYFTLMRTDTNGDLTVPVYVSGSAILGIDYTLNPDPTDSNSVVIPAGSNSVVFEFHAINDSAVEGPEKATLSLVDDYLGYVAPSYVITPHAEAAITIVDEDSGGLPEVSLYVPTPSIPENNTSSGRFIFSRTGSTQNDLFVNYTVSGTAAAGADFTTLPGVALIPAGQSSVAIPLHPIDEKVVEADESVVVTIATSATYIRAPDFSDELAILDDDRLTLTISATQSGAAEPSAAGRFTVKRDGDLTAALTAFYNVSGTAASGADYVPFSGSVTIPAGATSVEVVLNPLDDLVLEGGESVTLTLTNNVNYDVGTPGSATLVIRDNERPVVSVTQLDNAMAEPGSDTGAFRVSRNTVSGDLTVFLSLSGTAIPGADYLPVDNPVVIPNGSSSVTLEVIPFDDLHTEPVEEVRIFVAANANYDIGLPSTRLTIEDDDLFAVPAAGFCFSMSSVIESQSPGIAVALSQTSAVPITVDYQVIGGTAPGSRYSLPDGTLTIEPANWVAFIPLQINNNSTIEPNQTIRVVLYNPTNATLDGIKVHTYTILDDDTNAVSIEATAPVASESGPTPGNFRISRTGPTSASLLVNFQVTGSASAPTDYAPLGTSAIIPAGFAFVDLPIVPTDDPTAESNQTVVVTLISAPTAKIVAPNKATVTITDTDTNALAVVTVSSTNQPYAVEGGGNGQFVFTRTGPTNNALTVLFTVSGTAVNGGDYAPITNGVTIPAGQSSAIVPIVPLNDSALEGEETVIVTLTVRDTYQVLYASAATVTLQDNEQQVWLDASDFYAAEPGADIGEFTFSRFGTTNTAVQVFFTVSGTASNGVDYVAISNSFTIPAGSLTATLPIAALDDLLVEGPEAIVLTLQGNPAYSLVTPTNATMTLMDDEPMVNITALVASTLEGSQSNGVFRLTRFGNPDYEFTARLAISGTAGYGGDYPAFFTNVYFSRGITSIDLFVAPYNEAAAEADESVIAALVPDPAYSILAPSNAMITILDAGFNQTPQVMITKPLVDRVYLSRAGQGLVIKATVNDDGPTNTLSWTEMNGQDTFRIDSTNTADTAVLFTNAGIYKLRLTADDGVLQAYDEVTVIVGAADLVPPPSLYWPFDETNGSTVIDAGGGGNNGVFVGAPVRTNGIFDRALSFNGTNDWVRQNSGSNVFNNLKAFTLSLWVNTAATNVDNGILAASSNAPAGETLSLVTKSDASCGNARNVFEAVLSTTAGTARRVSAEGAARTNEWQHLVLTWSKGQAPTLYINGNLDQPHVRFAGLGGALTNCPDFLVGRGPAGTLNSWKGRIDDVLVFREFFAPDDVLAVGGGPERGGGLGNQAPIVEVGSNVIAQVNAPFVLGGTVTDDGLPNPPAAVVHTWSQIIDTNAQPPPPSVFIPDPSSLTNTVLFDTPADYLLRLTADDGEIETFAEVTVTAVLPTQVSIYPSDGDASELGPDGGEFTVTRDIVTNSLTVYLAISGIASNGVDFVEITNVVVFPVDSNFMTLPVMPFLDHRIEGDETLTLTIVSNASYYITSGEATVMIHDSPYGVWSVEHFTLEELTFPNLSGETADFDNDGLNNFVEYALDLDPKTAETHSPLLWSFEVSTNDNLPHFTVEYHRRLPPTDVAYAVYVGTNLFNWNTGPAYLDEFFRTNDPNLFTETVRTRVVAPSSTSRQQFINVRVWLEQVPLPPP